MAVVPAATMIVIAVVKPLMTAVVMPVVVMPIAIAVAIPAVARLNLMVAILLPVAATVVSAIARAIIFLIGAKALTVSATFAAVGNLRTIGAAGVRHDIAAPTAFTISIAAKAPVKSALSAIAALNINVALLRE